MCFIVNCPALRGGCSKVLTYADGKRRLAEVLQELQGARRTLEREAQKLEAACGHVSTSDAIAAPEMTTALKVISFLQEHTTECGPPAVLPTDPA